MRRTAFTLLEVIVSLILLGVIATGLFSFFKRTLVAKAHVQNALHKRMEVECAVLRLKQIVEALEKEAALSLQPHLVLRHVCTLDRDPRFTGSITSMLHLEGTELWLTTRSAHGKERSVLMLADVTKCEVSCFDTNNWVRAWDEERKDHPKMLKLSIQRKGDAKPMDFAFILDQDPI